MSLRFLLLTGLLFFLLACASTATPAPTLAPTDTPEPTSTPQPTLTATPELAKVFPINNTNCRSGPSTAYPVQVSLPANSEVKMLGRSADGEYYYVENPQSPGNGCWIKGSLVTVFGTVSIIPVFTPPPMIYPTAAPAEPTPSCDRSGTIRIINDTGGLVTLYLTGTAKFTFRINAGSQDISVCPGTYSYTGYGCGGASRNGTVSPGDEITFFCTTVP
jgi:hypothetical protein